MPSPMTFYNYVYTDNYLLLLMHFHFILTPQYIIKLLIQSDLMQSCKYHIFLFKILIVYQNVLLLHGDWHTNVVENATGFHVRLHDNTLIYYYLKLRHHEQEKDNTCSGSAC